MAVVNQLGVQNSLNSMTSKTGIGGLSSGMDIDELVVGLTSSGRMKIAKEQQGIQKLEWKQDAYRSVTTALEEFQASYLDVLSKTNFRSETFFSVKSADVSSTLISVIPSATAPSGDLVIESINQLAEAQRITGGHALSAPLQGTKAVATYEGDSFEELLTTLANDAIAFVLDGRIKTIQFDADFIQSARNNGMKNALQDSIDRVFGGESGNHTITVSDQEGNLTFTSNGSLLSIKSIGEESSVLDTLGFSDGQANRVSLYESLENAKLSTNLVGDSYSFRLNGVEFTFDKNNGVSDIMRAINESDAGVTMHYSTLADKLILTSNETGAGEHILIEETEGNLLSALGLTTESGADITFGQNAQLTINGVQISRGANIFTVDGVSIELHGKTAAGAGPIRISVRDDSSGVKDAMESFIKDYNNIIDLVNGLLTEKANNKYPPLTDDQKNEMSEKQIEKWEEKAKQGILSNDAALRGLLNDLRIAMSGPIGSGNIRLSDLGITTGKYQDGGKLTISDQAKFAEALKTKGDKIAKLFTDSENGIAQKLYKSIDDAVRKTGKDEDKGRLIRLAGIAKSTTEKNNSISKMIEQANKRVELLKQRLSADEKHLWSKFTAMETALQRFEMQSSMLTQFSFGK